MLGSVVLATTVLVGLAGSPASAQPVAADDPAPAVITVGGHTYDAAAIKAGAGYIHVGAQRVTLGADAQANLPAADYATVSRFVHDADTAALAWQRRDPGYNNTALNACTRKIRASYRAPASVGISIPSCAVSSIATVYAAVGAVFAAANSLDMVSERVAKVIAAGFAAGAAVLVAWDNLCNVFGSGRGIRVYIGFGGTFLGSPGCA